MDLETGLQEVSVVGAAGKMGRGIALLLAQEMASLNVQKEVSNCRLHLIDSNEKGLQDLRHYLKNNLKKFAEKKIIKLRSDFESNSKLVSNEQIVNAFVERAMDMLRFEAQNENMQNSGLIFEAIIEDENAKIQLLKNLKDKCRKEAFFLTNTSSIPISYLAKQSGLEGRIVGFHFYNPPAVQKLVELVAPQGLLPNLRTLSEKLVQVMEKRAVLSNDIAGFIGNGHFIREIHYACEKVQEWSREMKLEEAIVCMDALTKDYLLRPMGIFQLIDYVGIDVCDHIAKIMQEHLQEPLQNNLLQQMIGTGFIGGENYDGSQKKGFFSYEGTQKKEIYSFGQRKYEPMDKFAIQNEIKPKLTWKALQKDPHKREKIKAYLQTLCAGNAWMEQAAQAYLNKSNEIAEKLVKQGVAKTKEDVSEVLKLGFFHLYGVDEIPHLSLKDHS